MVRFLTPYYTCYSVNFQRNIAFVGLSDCRTIGLSHCRTIRPSDYQTVGLSDYRSDPIKSIYRFFISVYEKLFNIIFDHGVISDIWLVGYIKPLYKNKGNKFDPKNYRPLTILSCLGKLFTAILNERLNNYSEEFFVLKENQCGFREGYSKRITLSLSSPFLKF